MEAIIIVTYWTEVANIRSWKYPSRTNGSIFYVEQIQHILYYFIAIYVNFKYLLKGTLYTYTASIHAVTKIMIQLVDTCAWKQPEISVADKH
jgi:hypothetical protein